MKKILLIISFFAQLNANAQKSVQTPFWEATTSEQIEIQLKPLQEEFKADCKAYTDYLVEQSNEIKAPELDFSRNMPMRKYMKANYEAVFELLKNNSTKNTEKSIPMKSLLSSPILFLHVEDPIVSIDFSNLKNIKGSYSEGSLTEISKKFNLTDTQIEVFKSQDGLRTGIKIKGRDVACDLLNGKYLLKADAEYFMSLPNNTVTKMNQFYKQVEDQYYDIINQEQNIYVKAALLGYAYGKLYQNENVTAEDINSNIIFLLKNIFNPNSLDLNNNWIDSENKKRINFNKTMSAGYGSFVLRL